MSDTRVRSAERALSLGADPLADEARRVAEHLRAGGRDPRLDPDDGDVVQERARGCTISGARVVLRTWPRVLTWEVTALPMTAEGGAHGAAALEVALEQRSLSLGRLVPGARVLYIGTAVRRPRPGRRGWDRVEAQTAPGVWATYQVEAGALDHRTGERAPRQGITGPIEEPPGSVVPPPVEEVEWQSIYLGDGTHDEESLRRFGSHRERVYHSAVHAWRDWCRGGRVVRVAP